jgi:hypothetical protein
MNYKYKQIVNFNKKFSQNLQQKNQMKEKIREDNTYTKIISSASSDNDNCKVPNKNTSIGEKIYQNIIRLGHRETRFVKRK